MLNLCKNNKEIGEIEKEFEVNNKISFDTALQYATLLSNIPDYDGNYTLMTYILNHHKIVIGTTTVPLCSYQDKANRQGKFSRLVGSIEQNYMVTKQITPFKASVYLSLISRFIDYDGYQPLLEYIHNIHNLTK